MFNSKEIPFPPDAKIENETFETFVATTSESYGFIKKYYKMLSDKGWKEVDVNGRQHVFEKNINGKSITIAVLPLEQGRASGNKVKILFDFYIQKIGEKR